MKPPRIRNSVHGLGFLVFALFAVLQVNDIDPEIYYNPSVIKAGAWCLFYGLLAIGFLLSLYRRVPLWLPATVVAAGVVQMLLTGPGLAQNLFGEDRFTMVQASMSAEDPRVEMTREFFGALIAGFAALYLLRHERKNRKAALAESLSAS